MKCIVPGCQANTQVIDSRPSPDGPRRRRECTNGHKFTTFEIPAKAAKQYNALGRFITEVVATGKSTS